MIKHAWITVLEYATQIDRTRQYVNKMINSGKISKKSTKTKGRTRYINHKKADRDLLDNLSHINKKPIVKQSDPETLKKEKPGNKKTISDQEKKDTIKSAGLEIVPLAQAQTLKANYVAALKKIELKEKQGEYLLKSDVEKDAFDMARIIRDAVLNIPDRISAELASIKDIHVISEKLTSELTTCLEELTQ